MYLADHPAGPPRSAAAFKSLHRVPLLGPAPTSPQLPSMTTRCCFSHRVPAHAQAGGLSTDLGVGTGELCPPRSTEHRFLAGLPAQGQSEARALYTADERGGGGEDGRDQASLVETTMGSLLPEVTLSGVGGASGGCQVPEG